MRFRFLDFPWALALRPSKWHYEIAKTLCKPDQFSGCWPETLSRIPKSEPHPAILFSGKMQETLERAAEDAQLGLELGIWWGQAQSRRDVAL